jgi:hypothetical protein
MRTQIALAFLIASLTSGTFHLDAQLLPPPDSTTLTNAIVDQVSSDIAPLSPAQFQAALSTNGAKVSYVVQKQGDGQLWESVSRSATSTLTESGLVTNRLQQIGTGMHYFDGTAWKPSDPTFRETSDEFVVDKIQHRAHIKRDLNVGGAVFITTPDQKQIYSTPVALGIYEPKDGKFLVVGEITNCSGIMLSNNVLVFQDPFVDSEGRRLCGSLVYSVNQSSFEQDYVWQGYFDVKEYGFSSNAWVQVISEIQSAPEPDIIERPVYVEKDEKVRVSMATPDMIDQTIGFGEFVLNAGHAYTSPSVGLTNGAEGVVAKQLRRDGDRLLLIESVPYSALQAGFRSLPPCVPVKQASATPKVRCKTSYAAIASPPKIAKAAPVKRKPLEMAKVTGKPSGVVIDYWATIGGTLTGTRVFASSTNYIITANVYCSGAVIIEGGTIFKYKTNLSMTMNSSLTLKTSMYRPAIFTALDDTSVGDQLSTAVDSSYTGTINQNGYANPAISCPQTPAYTINHCRFCYAQTAIQYLNENGSSLTVNHSQFWKCTRGIYLTFSGGCGCVQPMTLNMNNTLMTYVTYPITMPPAISTYANLINCTFDHATTLLTIPSSAGTIVSRATNSIFANITGWGNYPPAGDYNAFYGTPSQFGTSKIPSSGNLSTSPFASAVGDASYYLSASSPVVNGGRNTGISSSLLADLHARTTKPPNIPAQTITTDTRLSPQNLADADPIDLGFHYPILDHAVGGVTVSGCTLTIDPGTVVGTYANASTPGLSLGSGSQLVSVGNPAQPIWFVEFNTVQEGSTTTWNKTTSGSIVSGVSGQTQTPGATFRFTDWSMLGMDDNNFRGAVGAGPLNFRDCEFHGGQVATASPTLNFTNCLFERVDTSIQPTDSQTSYFRNNTFFGGKFVYGPANSVVKDNIFDQPKLTVTGSYTAAYNACVSGYDQLANNSNPINLTASPAYKVGPLGGYYLDSGNDSSLIDQGSTTADQVGLYHYTVKTNFTNGLQSKEQYSTVDVGYHYVALGVGNFPIDTDGDSVPDYLEDANNSGGLDVGETDWSVPDLWITVDNKTKLTGTLNPAFTYHQSGLRSGDTLTVTYTTAAGVSSPAGNYDIVPVLSIANNGLRNYNLWITRGILTIMDRPIIVTQPARLSKNPGVSATFTVQAVGSPTLNYQWKKDSNPIAGATSSSYTIASVATSDSGMYSVTVNNSVGSATSTGAYLAIGNPIITQQPVSRTVVPDSTVSFDVIAQVPTGQSPPAFEWHKDRSVLYDSTKISGSGSQHLTVNDALDPDRGNYFATIGGTLNSAAAVLDVCHIYPLAIHTNVVIHHQVGDVLTADFGAGSNGDGDFGWLSWDGSMSGDNLKKAWINPLGSGVEKYENRAQSGDYVLARGKSVDQMTGSRADIPKIIDDLKLSGDGAPTITVLTWDASSSGTYRVYSFAKIRLLSISTTGNSPGSSMTFQYLGVAECDDFGTPTPNLPPQIGLSATALSYTENDPPKIIDATATVVDYDSPNFAGGSLTLDFTANGLPEDSLSIQSEQTQSPVAGQIAVQTSADGTSIVTYGGTNFGSVTGYLGRNTLSVKFNEQASRDAVQALLQKLTYYNLSDNPSEANRTLRVTVNDGNTVPVPASKTINVIAVNDLPTLADIPDITVTSDGHQRRVQLTGISAGGGENQTLSLSAASGDVNKIPTPTFDSYNGSATTATVKFTAAANSVGVVFLGVTLSDTDTTAHGGSKSVTKTFKVTLVPPPPQSDIPPNIVMPGPGVSYTAGSVAASLDSAATITDSDSADFDTGNLTAQFIANGQTDDRLEVLNDSTIVFANNVVTYNSIQIATTQAGAGQGTTPLTFTFNNQATATRVQALLRNVTYRNVGSPPSSLLPRTVQVVMTDGDGGTSKPVWKPINLRPAINSPPTVTLGNPITYLIAASPLTFAAAAAITDPETSQTDPSFSATITVKIVGNADIDDRLAIRNDGDASGQIGVSAAGGITLNGVTVGQITSQGSGPVPLVFTVQTSLQTVQAVLQNITFFNSSPTPSRLDRTIQLTVRETSGLQDSVPAIKVVHVSAPNELPIVHAGNGQTVIRSGGSAVAQLDGFVADDGLPSSALTISWSVLEAPDGVDPNTVSFSPTDSPTARATFQYTGRYVLVLTANDGTGDVSDTVSIFICDGERRSADVMLLGDRSEASHWSLPPGLTPPVRYSMTRALQLIDFLPSTAAQVGLVSFSGSGVAYLQRILTKDTQSVKKSTLPENMVSHDFSAIDRAIRIAELELTGARHTANADPVIVLFSDGETQDEAAAVSAAVSAKAKGIRIIVVGTFINPDFSPSTTASQARALLQSLATSSAAPDYYELTSFDSEAPSSEAISAFRGISSSFCAQKEIQVSAGADETIATSGGSSINVTLSGSASSPTSISTYHWDFLSQWSSGSATLNGNSSASTTATISTPVDPGRYVFKLTATDAALVSGNAYVIITTSSKPLDDYLVVAQDSSANLLDILKNDSPSGSLHIDNASGLFGSVSITDDGKKLNYTPPADFGGTFDVIQYGQTDAGGNPVQATAYVLVNPVNAPPVAANITYFLPPGGQTYFLVDLLGGDVLDHSFDPDAAESEHLASFYPFYLLDYTQPAAGLGTVSKYVPPSGNRFEWELAYTTPGVGTMGTDIFNYCISDTYGLTSTGTVTIVITDNQQLLGWKAMDDYATLVQGAASITIDVLGNDRGAPDTIFSFTQPSGSGNGSVSIDNTFNPPRLKYTPPTTTLPSSPIDFSYTLYNTTDPSVTAKVHVGFQTSLSIALNAQISNLDPDSDSSFKVVKQGILDVQGTAQDANNLANFVHYRVTLFTGNNVEIQSVDFTNRVSAGILGTLDLTTATNGLYYVGLEVQDFPNQAQHLDDTKAIFLASDLKVGRLAFSVADLQVPVEGVPIVVTRSYDSFDASSGDFGQACSFLLAQGI